MCISGVPSRPIGTLAASAINAAAEIPATTICTRWNELRVALLQALGVSQACQKHQ